MRESTQGYGIRYGIFHHRCVRKIPSTMGTQKEPTSDRQQVVQVQSPYLNTNSCTKLPRNLEITRIDPPPRKERREESAKFGTVRKKMKDDPATKKNHPLHLSQFKMSAIIHGHYTKRIPAVHKDERDRPLSTSI
ncbi:hypothetical protein ACS0TY_022745 [Phlomoides rotata]